MSCKLNETVRAQSDGPVTALGVGDWGALQPRRNRSPCQSERPQQIPHGQKE